MPVCIGMAALGVEAGLWFTDHHQLRNVPDAAALDAGWARREGSDINAAASNSIHDIGYDDTTDTLDVIAPPVDGSYAGDPQAIEITVTRTRPLLLAQLFTNGKTQEIRVRSVVRLTTVSGYCLLALDPTVSAAIGLQGTANVDLNGCGVNDNSNASDALDLGGGSLLNAAWTEVTGGIVTNGGGMLESQSTPETGVIPRPDPFAALSMPASSTCAYTNYNAGSSVTLSPGRYCGGLVLNSGANVTLNPGTYIVDGGTFRVNGGATLHGNGVTFVFTGSGTGYAQADIRGGATVTLSASISGSYAGLTIVQDRRAPTNGANKFNGGSGMDIQGAINSPTEQVQFTGGNSTGNRCTRIVAATISFTGNATLGDTCTSLGLPELSDDTPIIVE